MTRDEIRTVVYSLLEEHLGEKPLNDSYDIYDDLAADSLDMVEIMMEVEETFLLEPGSDVEFLERVDSRSVRGLIDFIEEKRGHK